MARKPLGLTMFHTFGRVYLEDIKLFQKTSQHNFIIFDNESYSIKSNHSSLENFLEDKNLTLVEFWVQLSNSREKLTIFTDFDTLTKLQIHYWISILKFPQIDSLYWLHTTYLQDLRIKSTPESHTLEGLTYIRSCRPLDIEHFQEIYDVASKDMIDPNISLKNVSFEYLLASYFYDNKSPYAKYFFDKINHLSWKQIIQEFFVIRNQLVNALFNNLNLALPDNFKLDYEQDIEAQMFGNPYLSWIHDIDFREDNTQYIKDNYDINQLAELYDNWIKYRRPKERTPELELELDNLTWITQAIIDKDWEHLFTKNLERDFGCIYVDNWLLHKANQVWTGKLYREANHSNEKETCKKLVLR